MAPRAINPHKIINAAAYIRYVAMQPFSEESKDQRSEEEEEEEWSSFEHGGTARHEGLSSWDG